MTRTRTPHLFSFLTLVATISLSGCAGFNAAAPLPDVPTEVSPGAIQGSVFGGHGPIVGAHVYVLETGLAYNGPSISKLSTGAGSDSVGTYVLTDNNGAFNITGDYTCDVHRPVYIAAAGGAPNSYPPFSVTSITATQVTPGNYNFQIAGTNFTYVGQQVALSGLTIDTFLNGTSPTVTAATASSFTINVSTALTVASGATSGTATPQGVANPAIVNIAVLGLCPGIANEFASTIHYVYMNEVSTVAAAYAFSGFGTGPYAIGAPSSNLVGSQNAAANANQLYDIQGSVVGAPASGDAHIARATTPAGNGIVPQSTINTLADILAACVDSNNSAQSASTPCNILLNNATNSLGTAAANTASAAFNIAHNPAGPPGVNSYNWVYILYNLPSGVIPFTPVLYTQPNDFQVALQYTTTSEGANSVFVKGPQSIATDASGNFWYTTQPTTSTAAGYIEEISPTGVSLYSHLNSNPTPYGNITIDTSGNAWAGTLTGYFDPTEVTVTGSPATYTLYNGFTGPYTYGQAAVADGSGNVFFVHGPTVGYPVNPTCCALQLSEVSASRGAYSNQPSLQSSFGNNFVNHGAIDNAGYLWFSSEAGNSVSRIIDSTTTGTPYTGFPLTTTCSGTSITGPESIAIDRTGAAWIPIYNGGSGTQVMFILANSASCYFTGANSAYGVAIDGASNVWITNRAGNSLTELISTSAAAATPGGVALTAGGLLHDPMNIATDISGDLMITNFAGNSLVEVIGGATPTYAPLSLAAKNNALGQEP
jgi:hypothetical protein